MNTWCKRLGIFVCLLVGLGLFVYMNGLQFTATMFTGSWSNARLDLRALKKARGCEDVRPCSSGPVRVLSYNVLCRYCAVDFFDSWEVRVPHIQEIIRTYTPDLIGFQELAMQQDMDDILAGIPGYEWVSYRLAKWPYADAALCFRGDRFVLLDSGQFWLSPYPWLPLSLGWYKTTPPRYLNWAHLRCRDSGFEFLFVNTHFDNNGPNKNRTAPMVYELLKKYSKKIPIVFTGDFNTDVTTTRYSNLIQGQAGDQVLFNTAELVDKARMNSAIQPDMKFKKTPKYLTPETRIDHILLAGPCEKKVYDWVLEAPVYTNMEWASRPSDHPAVFAEIEFVFTE